MPFYLYGSPENQEYHIDHTLVAAPNVQLTGGEVAVTVIGGTLPDLTDAKPYVEVIVDRPERAMQPFPPNKDINNGKFFFSPTKTLDFKIPNSTVTGTLTLSKNVYVDTDMLNEDPVPIVIAISFKVDDAPAPTAHELAAQDAFARGKGWQDIVVCI